MLCFYTLRFFGIFEIFFFFGFLGLVCLVFSWLTDAKWPKTIVFDFDLVCLWHFF